MKNKFRSIFHWILVDELAVGSLPKDEKDIDDKRTMALINKPNYS